MRHAHARPALAALIALLALAAPPAGAAATTPRTSLTAIEPDVMCVVCGVPLEVAESPAADDERRYIQGLVAQGRSKAEIERDLVAQYGRDVLATPRTGGFDLAAWLVPIIVVLALAAALVVLVPRWRARRPAPAPVGGPALDPGDARRLDDDLARFGP